MAYDEPVHQDSTDHDLASRAVAELDLVEPSAALLRRVARIPLDLPVAEPASPPWSSRLTRALLFAALGLGVLTGAVPWENATDVTESELESTLSVALATDWSGANLTLEESP